MTTSRVTAVSCITAGAPHCDGPLIAAASFTVLNEPQRRKPIDWSSARLRNPYGRVTALDATLTRDFRPLTRLAGGSTIAKLLQVLGALRGGRGKSVNASRTGVKNPSTTAVSVAARRSFVMVLDAEGPAVLPGPQRQDLIDVFVNGETWVSSFTSC